jgi:hypothetical protein
LEEADRGGLKGEKKGGVVWKCRTEKADED